MPGPSIDPAAGGRTVQYLVEVCDPCEADHYAIDGIEVSSFVTPAYFGLAPGPPYDMLGRIAGPFGLPPGGCLSWWDPSTGSGTRRTGGIRFYTGALRDAARDAPRGPRPRARVPPGARLTPGQRSRRNGGYSSRMRLA